jgi:subfamily B ATP-binding cassette protein MsbA
MSDTKPSQNPGLQTLWSSIKRIFRLSKPYRARFYTATLLALGSSAVGLSVPLGLKVLLDAVFQSSDAGLLDIIALVLFGLFIFQAFLSFGSSYWLAWVGERVVTDLRKSLYEHLHRLGFRYFADKRLGEITSRLTNDVGSVRTALTDSLPQTLTLSFSLIGSITLMFILNWRLCLIVFITVPAVTLSTRYFGGKIRKLSRDIQDDLADSTAVAEEALGAVRIVKAFAREIYETGRYSESVEKLFQTSRRKILLTSLFYSGIGVMFMTTLVTIFWYGGKEVLAGRLTTGDLVAFIFYAFSIARSVAQMSRLYTTMTTAVGASDRIFELLEESPEIEDAPGATRLHEVDGRVSFNKITFEYEENRPALSNISFDVQAGETIAVVGPSGAGKTTLINLIPRFYDPQEGQILVDGIDIKTIQKNHCVNRLRSSRRMFTCSVLPSKKI